uniref:Uncharacterized protein n=1 Tax=Ditylenchus dipsaci TaxID=166011 RepID=A0A915DTS3_9BILA
MSQGTHAAHSSPNVWLYLALPGGVIFVQCYFCEPYFCVRFLQWNNNTQLNEYIRPNSQITKEETEHLRTLNRTKNDLIQKCHVHSITYDFHLRIVARYLLGGTQVLFNSGYNTNAFLVDFLQYYGCRPPFARNCIYEETINCSRLQVGHGNIWEFFLDYSEQHFGLKIVRLKNMDQANSSDEFMLVSKDEKELFFKQPYKFVTVVLNNARPGSFKEHQISMKFYVILVTEDNAHPMLDMAEEMRLPTLATGGEQLTPFVESETDEEEQLDNQRPCIQPKSSLNNRMERLLSNRTAYDSSQQQQHNNSYCMQCTSEAAETSALADLMEQDNDRRSPTASNRNSPTLMGAGARRSSETPAVSFLASASTSSGYSNPTNMQRILDNNLQKTESSSMYENLDQVIFAGVAGNQRQLATSKVPPRRHRKTSSSHDYGSVRESIALVPPEQVTYLHYFSSHQRKLQQLLEETAKKERRTLQVYLGS